MCLNINKFVKIFCWFFFSFIANIYLQNIIKDFLTAVTESTFFFLKISPIDPNTNPINIRLIYGSPAIKPAFEMSNPST